MAVNVSVISIATPVSSATGAAGAQGLGPGGATGPDPASAGRVAAPDAARPSFSEALQDAHHARTPGAHPSTPGQGATTGIALPPTGNPLPGAPPCLSPRPSPPTSPVAVSGANGSIGDPAGTTIGRAAQLAAARPGGTPDTVPHGTIQSAAAAPTGHAASSIPNAGFATPAPVAAHDAATGIPGSAADSAGSPSSTAVSAAAGMTPIPAGAASLAAHAPIVAALHASDAVAAIGADAEAVPASARGVAPARAPRSGGGDVAAPNAGASGAVPAGAAAPTGAIAKFAAAAHAAMPAHAPAATATAASPVVNLDGSRVAAAALTPVSTPAAGNLAAPPAHGPIDLGSHTWPAALADRITWLADQNLNGASLQVNPPHLGPVDLRISVERGHASVWIGAHDGAAYDALQAGAPQLRELLGSHGFTQVNVDVSRQSYRDPGAAHQSFAPPDERGPAAPAAARAAPSARVALGVLDAYA